MVFLIYGQPCYTNHINYQEIANMTVKKNLKLKENDSICIEYF